MFILQNRRWGAATKRLRRFIMPQPFLHRKRIEKTVNAVLREGFCGYEKN